MASIKFEEHIKEKLEVREIQPSAGSWDKLNSRLDSSKKSSVGKWWISTAAAVVIILIASILFVGQQDQISIPVVESPSENKIKKLQRNTAEDQPVRVAVEDGNGKKDPAIVKSNAGTTKSDISGNLVAGNSKLPPSESPAPRTDKSREILVPTVINEITVADSRPDLVQAKIQEVLTKLTIANTEGDEYTAAEVDALLAQAAKEISSDKNINNTNTLTADALLADVEYEVDQSFRKEVLDFLKEEFLKAKTAVATRND